MDIHNRSTALSAVNLRFNKKTGFFCFAFNAAVNEPSAPSDGNNVSALVSANADLHSSTAKLKPIETAIREKKDLQKQVLAYAKTRDVRDGLKKQKTDKARKAYREKHESDFIIADAAVRYFRQKGITKLPTYKSLQAEIEQLTAEKNALYNEYRANKERVRELQTMKSNLSQMHHGEPSRQKKHEQER